MYVRPSKMHLRHIALPENFEFWSQLGGGGAGPDPSLPGFLTSTIIRGVGLWVYSCYENRVDRAKTIFNGLIPYFDLH